MSSGMAGLVGALIGAIAVFGSGILVEGYERHRDRQGIASALAGEIAGALYMSHRRKYAEYFEKIVLPQLTLGQNVVVPKMVSVEGFLRLEDAFPVIGKYLDKLGLLPISLPERIVKFYQFVLGIRLDIQRLAAGEFDADLARKAGIIKEDLDLWKETVILGDQLVSDLRKVARSRFIHFPVSASEGTRIWRRAPRCDGGAFFLPVATAIATERTETR